MKQGHVFLKKLPKQILQYAILLLGAFCALVPIVSCVTTAFKTDDISITIINDFTFICNMQK